MFKPATIGQGRAWGAGHTLERALARRVWTTGSDRGLELPAGYFLKARM
jgi:hypothetical protein